MIRHALLACSLALTACTDDGPPTGDASAPGDAAPARSCRTSFTFMLGRPARSVAIGGEWNGFSPTATPMTDTGTTGVYRAEVSRPPGDYGYKFVVDGSEWQLDPAAVERKYVGSVENSRVRVEDCAVPTLCVARQSATGDGALELDLQYNDGAEMRGLDPASVEDRHPTRLGAKAPSASC